MLIYFITFPKMFTLDFKRRVFAERKRKKGEITYFNGVSILRPRKGAFPHAASFSPQTML